MIRLTLLLCASLLLALHFGGQDNGQKRFGLIQAQHEAALKATLQPEPASQAALQPAAPVVQPAATNPAPTLVPVVFAPEKPLIVATKPAVAPPVSEQPIAVKYVKGRSVNVRSGPSTQDSVVGKLSRGEAVAVIWVEDNGWARVRIEGDGVDGYMSADFLTDQ